MGFELDNLKREVDRKADQWRVDDLNNQVTQLKNTTQELNQRIDNMGQALHQAQQAYNGLHQLLEMLSGDGSGTNDDFMNRIIDIKNNSQ